MTITLSSPASGYLGNGHSVAAHTDQTGAWHLFLADVYDPLLAFKVAHGSSESGGPYGGCQLGVASIFDGNGVGMFQGLPAGNAVVLRLTYQDTSFATIDTQDFTTFLWDPVSGIPGLFVAWSGEIESHLAGHDPMLNDILANTQSGAFHSPLLGVMTTTIADGSPFSGGAAIDLVLPSIPLVQVVGLTWQAITIPDVGRGTVGVIEESSRRVMQAVIFHTLASGATFADQVVDARGVTGSVQFDSWNPTDVSLYIWPGFVVDVNFLLAP